MPFADKPCWGMLQSHHKVCSADCFGDRGMAVSAVGFAVGFGRGPPIVVVGFVQSSLWTYCFVIFAPKHLALPSSVVPCFVVFGFAVPGFVAPGPEDLAPVFSDEFAC